MKYIIRHSQLDDIPSKFNTDGGGIAADSGSSGGLLDEALSRVWNCLQQIAPDHKKSDLGHADWLPRGGAKSSFVSKDDRKLEAGHREILDAETLEEAFRDLLDELDLSPEKEKELYSQPADKKRTMILEQNARKNKAERRGCAPPCNELIHQLEAYLHTFPERYAMPLAVQQIESLAISLRSESFSFVQEFLEAGGASLLVALLNEARRRDADGIAAPLLGCFRALLNSSVGRNGVLESDDILLAIAGSLDLRNAKCKILVLEILSAMCLVAGGGHRAVLDALTAARPLLGERARFQTLVDDLHREHDRGVSRQSMALSDHSNTTRNRDTERVRIAVMSLVNALLKSGHAEQSLEFRLHLRYELLMLGIQDVIDRLRNEHGSVLENHFDLFEMMRQEDEHELTSSVDSGASSPIDFENPSDMAEALSSKLDNTLALPHFISLLQHLLMVPSNEQHVHLWRLFDLVLQQLSMQSAMGALGSNVDSTQFSSCAINVNMDDLIARLRTENECERLEKELSEAHAELDTERRRVVELENRVSDLQDGVSLSSFSRVSDLSSSPTDPCHSPTFFNNASSVVTSMSVATVKPPPFVPPPPPPPTAEQLRQGFRKDSVPQKKVPKPSCQLRSLNWTVLPYNRINGTIWEKMEDEKLYKQIDLTEFSVNFSSALKSDDVESTAAETLQRMRRRRTSQVTVIDARRAQNCTIMLSKLKLSHRDIRNTVFMMDERRKLPKDMIEQMLKFIPTKEEIVALRDAVQRHKSPTVLALADRFLYEIAQVPRYEQRLRCLLTIRTFQERLDELTPYLNVIRASSVMTENKKVKQFLTLILAIGNYLNYGKRIGNAYGFTINSLSVIHSVKSASRSDRNLMHFIVEIVEKKFPDLLKLKRELSPVYDAAKYNREEMDTEFRLLEISLREMMGELAAAEHKYADIIPAFEPNRKLIDTLNSTAVIAEELPLASENIAEDESFMVNGTSPKKTQSTPAARAHSSDRFIPVVKAFLESARKALRDAQYKNREMDEKFSICTKIYGVETDSAKKCSPDEFFGAFTRFFTQFSDCQKTLWAEHEEIERIKRQTLVRSIFTKKCGSKSRKQGNMNKDFESLVNALQSGEIFSEDLNRLRTSIRVKGVQRSPSRRKLNNNQQSYESTKIEINGNNVCTAIVA